MPIRILEKDPVRMKDKKTTARWITKKPKKMEDKETTAKWITKKPTKWITKKSEPNWITKKEAKEHDTTSARKWITKKKPARSPHGLGSIVKKIVTKIKPKPKGVFKPKPKEVNVDKLLKNLGDEIKAAPLPPQLKKSLEKLKKAYPSRSPHARNKESKKLFKTVQGKATGGRIGLSHGGSVGAAIRGRGAEIK